MVHFISQMSQSCNWGCCSNPEYIYSFVFPTIWFNQDFWLQVSRQFSDWIMADLLKGDVRKRVTSGFLEKHASRSRRAAGSVFKNLRICNQPSKHHNGKVKCILGSDDKTKTSCKSDIFIQQKNFSWLFISVQFSDGHDVGFNDKDHLHYSLQESHNRQRSVELKV